MTLSNKTLYLRPRMYKNNIFFKRCNMYAVIKSGGKQYKVANDEVIKIEKTVANPGDVIRFEEVIASSDGKEIKLGSPSIKGASVTAEVLEQTRGEKLVVFKKRRRKNSRRRNGHRQYLTVVRIIDITGKDATAKGKSKAKAKTENKAAAETKAEPKAVKKDAAPKAKTAKTEKATDAKAETKAKQPAAKKVAKKSTEKKKD